MTGNLSICSGSMHTVTRVPSPGHAERSSIEAVVRRALRGVQIDEVSTLTGGESFAVHQVRLEDGTAVVVKSYDPERSWKQRKEVHVYGLLAEALHGSVPAVLHAEDAGPFGQAFLVLSRLPGRPLSELSAAFAPDTLRALYRRIGELMRTIHEVHQPAYGYLVTGVIDPERTNVDYMTRQFDSKLREFAELGGAADLGAAIERFVAAGTALLARAERPVLCHNDLHEANVLVTADGTVSGLVDVENAVAADPLLDLAKTDCYSIRGDPVRLGGLLEGYGELPDDWRDRTALYRLYHALELWDWFASTGVTAPLPGLAADIRKIVG